MLARSDVISAAYQVFQDRGYFATSLEDIAQTTGCGLAEVESHFSTTASLLQAVLTTYSPQSDLKIAIASVKGESAEDILRNALSQMVGVARKHDTFFELVLVDSQVNNGTFLSGLGTALFPDALSLLQRLKDTGQIRPISDMILARTLVAMFIGFIGSERAMPQAGKLALRLIPPRAWLDGMVDLMLYGILEDNQR